MPYILLYLIVGLVVVALLHRTLRAYTQMSPAEVKRKGGIAAGIGLVIGSLFSPRLRRFAWMALAFMPWGSRARGHGRASAGNASSSTGAMTAEEARDILGVEKGAGKDEIETAYKRLMRSHHPDQGGSDYFAKKLNEAREVLLGRR